MENIKKTFSTIIKDVKKELKDHYSCELYPLGYKDMNALRKENLSAYKRAIKELVDEIKALKNVYGVKTEEDCEYVSFWVHIDYVYKISIAAKPCKEFLSLNNWLGKYADRKLKIDEVRMESVSGKRSSYSVDDTSYLMHSPESCQSLLKELRESRSTKDTIAVEIVTDTYWGDRFNSYGEDMECEWNGTFGHYAKFTVKTPTGRVKKVIEGWV